MTKLTARARRAIPSRDFAGPDRSYPIEDKSHARNALARASGKPVEARVRAAVHRKYPDIGEKSVKKDPPGNRPHHSMMKRGHFETHARDTLKMGHEEFNRMDHGDKHDFMDGRDGKADGPKC